MLADAAADVEAVDVREADVEHDDADGDSLQLLQCLLAAARPNDREPIAFEVRPDERCDAVFVLDHERTQRGAVDSEQGCRWFAHETSMTQSRAVEPLDFL